MSTPIEAAYRLTPMQQGLLFHTLSRPDQPTYFEQIHFTIEGRLHSELFVAAWNWVMDRHSVLRTGFAWKELKEPLQLVGRSTTMPLDYEDWRGREAAGEAWCELLEHDARKGFDMAQAPLMRLTLRRTADDRHLCLWSHHHILLDGWSFGIVLREVQQCYAALVTPGAPPTLPPARPFADFVSFLEKRNSAADRLFWRRYLDGFEHATRIQIDLGQGVHEGGIEHTLAVQLEADVSAEIQVNCAHLGVSLSALVHGAWGRLLAAYTLMVGLSSVATALFWLYAAPARGLFATDILPALLFYGVGGGLCFPAATALALSSAAPGETGAVSGLLNTTYQIGGALGLAALSALAAHEAAAGRAAGASVLAALHDGHALAYLVAGVAVLCAVAVTAIAARFGR